MRARAGPRYGHGTGPCLHSPRSRWGPPDVRRATSRPAESGGANNDPTIRVWDLHAPVAGTRLRTRARCPQHSLVRAVFRHVGRWLALLQHCHWGRRTKHASGTHGLLWQPLCRHASVSLTSLRPIQAQPRTKTMMRGVHQSGRGAHFLFHPHNSRWQTKNPGVQRCDACA